MSRVTIWDLDYYYAKERRNMFNADAMKISSYHKQLGDSINFVTTEDDIRRPYDIYYIFKEKKDTPNPPIDFFTNSHVKWWGAAVKSRVKWKMSNEILMCRPDYLLYPEKNTKEERSEQVRLFNNEGQLLPRIQNWTNSFKNKYIIVTDYNFWFSSKKELILALNYLKELPHISFQYPMWLARVMKDKDIKQLFFQLNFIPGSNLEWSPVYLDDAAASLAFYGEFKEHYPHVGFGVLKIHYCFAESNHWLNKEDAFKDFAALKRVILQAKNCRATIEVVGPTKRLDTPYFMFFEACANWTKEGFNKMSWLEFITYYYGQVRKNKTDYWKTPSAWNEVFRDLLRQTWEDKEFLLSDWGDKAVSINEIPWELWKQEFKLEI